MTRPWPSFAFEPGDVELPVVFVLDGFVHLFGIGDHIHVENREQAGSGVFGIQIDLVARDGGVDDRACHCGNALDGISRVFEGYRVDLAHHDVFGEILRSYANGILAVGSACAVASAACDKAYRQAYDGEAGNQLFQGFHRSFFPFCMSVRAYQVLQQVEQQAYRKRNERHRHAAHDDEIHSVQAEPREYEYSQTACADFRGKRGACDDFDRGGFHAGEDERGC